jgi:membrane protease YdiL (CAAX protease family)
MPVPSQAKDKSFTAGKIIVAILLGFLCALVWMLYGDIVFVNKTPTEHFEFHGFYPLGLGLSAIITVYLFDRNFKSLALRKPLLKDMGIGAIMAVMLTIVPFGLSLFLYLTGFSKTPQLNPAYMLVAFAVFIFVSIGEELMWRGLLYTELSKLFTFRTTSILIGVLWSVWHYPLIVHTRFLYSDRPAWYSVPMFTIAVTASSFIYNYLRKVSGSIWPCVLLHTLENWLFFSIIAMLERPEYKWSTFFMSDIGIIYVLSAIAGAIFCAGKAETIKENQ